MKNKLGLQNTILSLSLLTVMAGAAMSPALSGIALHFEGVNILFIKMILTVPAIFIILTSLVFPKISRHLGTKYIAIIGLIVYLIGGLLGGVTNSIYALLFCRALLGIGVGLIMPLSTGLFAYYFKPEEMSKLMGYSSAMNSMGAIVSMALSGYLATFSWRHSFLVYLLGVVAVILVIVFLPNTKIKPKKASFSFTTVKENIFYYFGAFATMTIFYVFPTNFAIVNAANHIVDVQYLGLLMSVQGIVAFTCGLMFQKIVDVLDYKVTYVGACSFIAAYAILATQHSIVLVILGIALIGVSLGMFMPYFNKSLIARTEKANATSVMAIMSACVFLGQIASPFFTQVFEAILGIDSLLFPYYFSIGFSILMLAILIYKNHKPATKN